MRDGQAEFGSSVIDLHRHLVVAAEYGRGPIGTVEQAVGGGERLLAVERAGTRLAGHREILGFIDARLPQSAGCVRQPFRLVDQTEFSAPPQQIGRGGADIRQTRLRFGAGSAAGAVPGDFSAGGRVIGRVADHQIKGAGGKMLPHLPEVDTLKREPIRQAVFGGGPLCQRHSRRLNIDPGDGQFRLPLQEQRIFLLVLRSKMRLPLQEQRI